MKIVDYPLLSLVERFAQFVQRMTGITPIKIALVGDVIFGLGLIAVWMSPDPITPMKKIYDTVFFVFIVVVTIFVYPTMEADITRDASQGLSNRCKARALDVVCRVMATLLLVNDVILFVASAHSFANTRNLVTSIGLWVALYFIACDPLPPGESKIGKFIKTLFGGRKQTA